MEHMKFPKEHVATEKTLLICRAWRWGIRRARRLLRRGCIAFSMDRYAAKENYVTPHPDVKWWEGHLNQVIIREAAGGGVSFGKVLDLGCNHGANSVLMARQGYDVTGVDLNAQALAVAEDLRLAESPAVAQRLHFLVSRLDALPFADGAFSGAFMLEVLEHLYPTDRTAIFAEIIRVLKPGAHLLITVPYEHAYDDGVQHVAFFDRESLREVLQSLGLQVLSVERDQRTDSHTPEGHDRLTALCARP